MKTKNVTKPMRDLLQEIDRELAQTPVRRILSARAKHCKFRLQHQETGESRILVLANTPSDGRAWENTMARVRRIVRELSEEESGDAAQVDS
jgi:histone H3/H4